MIKVLAVILNFLIPGLGSLVLHRWVHGIIQIFLLITSLALMATVFLTFFGLVLFVPTWIYAQFITIRSFTRARGERQGLNSEND